VDSEGETVIIELKRGSDKLQLLQAISYAAMISDLTWEEIEAKIDLGRMQGFKQFLADNELDDNENDKTRLNLSQRVVLIAESYDYEVLRTAQWLTDKGLNISCYEVALARDAASNAEYLSAIQLFPAKPLAKQARLRGSLRNLAMNAPKLFEKRLSECSNKDIREFLEEISLQNPRWNRKHTSVIFPLHGKIRFRLSPRKQYARVVQAGRFVGDELKWNALSSPAKPRKNGETLVFHLNTAPDVEIFRKFINTELMKIEWQRIAFKSEDEDEDSDENE
jgi:hypothetical protein